jgi:hypothetical protein
MLSWAKDRSKKNKQPATIRAIELNGRLYTCVAGEYGPHDDYEAHTLVPLYTPDAFNARFHGRLDDEKLTGGYGGQEVTVNRKRMIMGPRGEQRRIVFVKAKAPAQAKQPAAAKPANRPKQTYRQWLSSLAASLNGRGLNDIYEALDTEDPVLRGDWEGGRAPRDVAQELAKAATTKKGSKKR